MNTTKSTVADSDVVRRIRQAGAVAVLRLTDHSRTLHIGQAIVAGGLDVLEVTFDHPDAAAALRGLADALPASALLGAGTIRQPGQVEEAAAAGARFCVSPHTDPAIIAAALAAGLEPLPGAATATEVATAVDAGARLVKLFPAGPLGLAYLRAMRGPFAGVLFMPTGGIRHSDVLPWLQAGAVAVGLGSDLVPAAPTAADVEPVRQRARSVAEQIRAYRDGTAP
jgi:Entner-Doudoroff aldolase